MGLPALSVDLVEDEKANETLQGYLPKFLRFPMYPLVADEEKASEYPQKNLA
jgi:hypothetical protein